MLTSKACLFPHSWLGLRVPALISSISSSMTALVIIPVARSSVPSWSMRLSSSLPLSSIHVTPDRSMRIGSPLREVCASSQLFSNTSTQSPASVPSTNSRRFEPLLFLLIRITALCLHSRSGGALVVLSACLPSTCQIQGGDGVGGLRVISIED